MAKPMPIGVDDFAEARRHYYFVDKTKFISEFWRQHGAATLITRPRRFGKTMTLSMLKYFFSEENAAENRKLFDGLEVSEDAAVMAEQGKRPVLFLTLKEWKFVDWETMQGGVAVFWQDYYNRYDFLLKSEKIGEPEKEIFREILMGRAGVPRLMSALTFLIDLLARYTGKPVVLLLDEYDAPIQSAWERGYYAQAIDFMRVMLTGALKTNLSLDFAVLTGVLRVAKESIFSDLNNLQVASLLSGLYPTAMGFTTDEVAKMAKDLGKEEKMDEIRDWYDGYQFCGEEIYNPWSVVNYFGHHCEVGPYWVNTSGNGILKELMRYASLEQMENIHRLLQGGTVQAFLREGVIYSDIGEDEDALYTMLLTTGYLTSVRAEMQGLEREYTLRVPNKEILSLFSIEVVKRFQKGLSKSSFVRLMQAFLSGNKGRVEMGLSRYLEVLASTFDTAGKEAFYHGFVLGMTALLIPAYEVRSNRESGYGRYDIAVFPKEKGKAGLILEFKTAEKEDDIEKKADEAIGQIESRDYRAEFRAQGVEPVYAYGIAFCGKQVTVRLRNL